MADPPLAPPPFEAALVMPVPEAEPLVSGYRQRYDRSAALGMPAHITITYPFRAYVTRPGEVLSELRSLLSAFPEFPFTLSEVRTFPEFVYLAPSPPDPFLALIDAILSRFPDSPPYGGEYDEIIPHLTVAQAEKTGVPALREQFSSFAAPFLPLAARARLIWLVDNSETLWKTRAVLPLGSAPPGVR